MYGLKSPRGTWECSWGLHLKVYLEKNCFLLNTRELGTILKCDGPSHSLIHIFNFPPLFHSFLMSAAPGIDFNVEVKRKEMFCKNHPSSKPFNHMSVSKYTVNSGFKLFDTKCLVKMDLFYQRAFTYYYIETQNYFWIEKQFCNLKLKKRDRLCKAIHRVNFSVLCLYKRFKRIHTLIIILCYQNPLLL